MQLTLFPRGLGFACPRCGKGTMRAIHPFLYNAPQQVYAGKAIDKWAKEGIEALEDMLQAEAEMDKYGRE